jgi:hypothetical protein
MGNNFAQAPDLPDKVCAQARGASFVEPGCGDEFYHVTKPLNACRNLAKIEIIRAHRRCGAKFWSKANKR